MSVCRPEECFRGRVPAQLEDFALHFSGGGSIVQKVHHREIKHLKVFHDLYFNMNEGRMDNFGELIEKICSLQRLFDDIPIDSKRIVLQKSFKRHIENFVHKMEEMYYKKIILNRSITRMHTNQEKEIQQTFNTLNAFMPLMIAYSTMKNGSVNVSSSTADPFREADVCENDDS